jgi:hypothetical protein
MRSYFGGFRTVEAQEARRWFRRGHRGDHAHITIEPSGTTTFH